MTVAEKLDYVYQSLHQRYGPQHWWPADDPFEVIVGAILTQAAAWANVERAIGNLKACGVLTPMALAQLSEPELASLIYPSGYYNAKAKKLAAFVAHLIQRYHGDLQELFTLDLTTLRRELLRIHGIGPETADSIALYAAAKPVFVIDAYTRRICARLGLSEENASYENLQRLFMDNLPPDPQLFNEYHALLVRHGKELCRKQPRCAPCPLTSICLYNTSTTPNALSPRPQLL